MDIRKHDNEYVQVQTRLGEAISPVLRMRGILNVESDGSLFSLEQDKGDGEMTLPTTCIEDILVGSRDRLTVITISLENVCSNKKTYMPVGTVCERRCVKYRLEIDNSVDMFDCQGCVGENDDALCELLPEGCGIEPRGRWKKVEDVDNEAK